MIAKASDFRTTLPQGYSFRSAHKEDAEAVTALLNAHSQALLGVNTDSAGEVVHFWETPGVDIEKDTRVVFDEHGVPAAYADVYDANEPHVHIYTCGYVRPDLFGQGLGSALADWLIERGLNGLDRAPQGARVVLAQYILVKDEAGVRVLESRGFERVRGSYDMRIDLNDEPAEPRPVPGIVIRPLDMPTEFAAAVRAIRTSFKDHYGFVDETFEQSMKRWQYMADTIPYFDPSVFYVAMDGNEVAGVCYCLPHTEEDETMAWVETLGVRREWRGRGIGYALLRTAFREFHKRGFKKVGLGVDAQSLTGATKLYERAGMTIARQYHAFEKEIRPGVELSTQRLDQV